jgi:hypothetical protein
MTRAIAATVRPRVPIAALAAVGALSICCSTGLIGGWGRWYSHDMAYRRQTEAFLRCETALSRNIADLSWDMAWSQGGVQQVWGLGVPTWRLPFELLAHAFGQPAFPDRLALAAAIALSAYVIIASLLPPARLVTGRQWIHAALTQPERLIVAFLLIAFPPVLGLCSGPFNVYEEPVVFGYYYAIGLFASTEAFARRATPTRYVLNGLLAGLIGFIRPTLFIYGIATVLSDMRVMRRERWPLSRVGIAPALLIAGGLTLSASNARRFGGRFEFGHRLNATASDIMYASRFGASFDRQPYWRRTLELLGALCFVRELNGVDNFQTDVVRWQLPTPRWRHFYSRTFDASHLVICVGAIAVLAGSAIYRRSSPANSPNNVGALAWIVPPMCALTAFYATYYSISSRYILDFAPAIATAVASLLLFGVERLTAKRNTTLLRWILAALSMLWWAIEMELAQNVLPQPPPWGQIHVIDAMSAVQQETKMLPLHYLIGSKSTPWSTGLEFNGFGWEEHTGLTGPVVMLYVENLAELRIECRWASSRRLSQRAIDCIRAKVGLETLKLTSAEKCDGTLELVFDRPDRAAYRRGIQPIFISFVPADDILAPRSPWRLQRVDWIASKQLRDDEGPSLSK